MKGYVEESPEVTAARKLRDAAREYVGHELLEGYAASGTSLDKLLAAGVAYAEARKPKRKARTT